MNAAEYSRKLMEKKLKVTPQRMAILEAIFNLNNHPSADQIIEYIRNNYPNISTATVYKVLDAFVSCGLVKRVKTERDIMRYDALTESHHHIYCTDSDCIEDYKDEKLNQILKAYFEDHQIPGFDIEDLKLHIVGKFTNKKE